MSRISSHISNAFQLDEAIELIHNPQSKITEVILGSEYMQAPRLVLVAGEVAWVVIVQ